VKLRKRFGQKSLGPILYGQQVYSEGWDSGQAFNPAVNTAITSLQRSTTQWRHFGKRQGMARDSGGRQICCALVNFGELFQSYSLI